MGDVRPLNARTAAMLADPAPAPQPHGYVTLQPAARHAFTALEGRMSELRRIFSGSATTLEGHSRIDAICAEAMIEITRVRRFAR